MKRGGEGAHSPAATCRSLDDDPAMNFGERCSVLLLPLRHAASFPNATDLGAGMLPLLPATSSVPTVAGGVGAAAASARARAVRAPRGKVAGGLSTSTACRDPSAPPATNARR